MKMQQSGAALVIALVIVAIGVVIATSLVWNNHLDMRRLENQLYGEQAMQFALGAEDWSGLILSRDSRDSDHLLEPWAQQGIVLPVDGGLIEGQLHDLQGRFNINNLVNYDENEPRDAWVAIYRRLIENLGLEARLVDATLDWLDRDQETTGFNGAEDTEYLGNTPAYRTPNRPVSSVSELRGIAGMTPEQFAVLAPYLTALVPAPAEAATPLNVNTAAPELIAALADNISPDAISVLMEVRSTIGITSEQEWQNIIGNTEIPPGVTSISSHYFQSDIVVTIGSTRLTLYSVYRRDDSGAVTVVQRALGTL